MGPRSIGKRESHRNEVPLFRCALRRSRCTLTFKCSLRPHPEVAGAVREFLLEPSVLTEA